jgi:A/G-specific adenine glycosylase
MPRPPAKTPSGPSEPDLPAPPRVISAAIETWFHAAARDLPWRRRRTPWRSFVSELMLQQTQVSRVADRFEPFMERFPTPQAMVDAGEDAVLALWEGLGYYRRARLLHAAAVRIVERHDGEVPADAGALLELPGVGRYTAGSIASTAFGLAEPIVDGNVVRVVARLSAIDARSDDPELVSRAWSTAASLVENAAEPGRLNEGLMELGATVCTPVSPSCNECPCRDHCRARDLGLSDVVPRPKIRPTRRRVHLDLLLLRSGDRLSLQQRPSGGLWGGLWQPPAIESEAPISDADRRAALIASGIDPDRGALAEVARVRRLLTHREVLLTVWFWRGDVDSAEDSLAWFDRTAAAALGMAKPVRAVVDAFGW